MENTPTLRYFLSETYGPVITDPTTADKDADVYVETDLSDLEDALTHNDINKIKRLSSGNAEKINIRGREIALGRHLVDIINDWHKKYGDALQKADIYNGLFINYAPRDERFNNGPSFYVAEMENDLRIVTTFPGDILSKVRNSVIKISEIPNENNPIFQDTAQFRSRDAHRWLRRNAQTTYPEIELSDEQQQDTLDEKYFDNSVDGLRLEFVDIYGNMLFENDRIVRTAIKEKAQGNERWTLHIQGRTIQGVQPTTSLTEGVDGNFLIYANGSHIDVVRKWTPDDTPKTAAEQSIFQQLRDPKTGELPQELHTGMQITLPDGRILGTNGKLATISS